MTTVIDRMRDFGGKVREATAAELAAAGKLKKLNPGQLREIAQALSEISKKESG